MSLFVEVGAICKACQDLCHHLESVTLLVILWSQGAFAGLGVTGRLTLFVWLLLAVDVRSLSPQQALPAAALQPGPCLQSLSWL